MPLKIEIITPEKRAYAGEADAVSLPGKGGEVEILPGHVPLTLVLEAGALRIAQGGKSNLLAVDRGFARVLGDTVSILTEAAIDVEDIDTEAAAQAQARAKESLEKLKAQGEFDSEQAAKLESLMRFALVQQLVKNKPR